jgi:hypothetical protein
VDLYTRVTKRSISPFDALNYNSFTSCAVQPSWVMLHQHLRYWTKGISHLAPSLSVETMKWRVYTVSRRKKSRYMSLQTADPVLSEPLTEHSTTKALKRSGRWRIHFGERSRKSAPRFQKQNLQKRGLFFYGKQEYLLDTIGFWRWCITHRDIRFSDFVHRPDIS